MHVPFVLFIVGSPDKHHWVKKMPSNASPHLPIYSSGTSITVLLYTVACLFVYPAIVPLPVFRVLGFSMP